MNQENRKQTAFLRSLISYCPPQDATDLHRKIQKAEKNERCLRTAMTLVGVAAAASAVGIGYCSVLMPTFFHSERPHLVAVFTAFTLGSLFCLAVFLFAWLKYCRVLNKLHEESRRLILHTLQSRLGTPHLHRETTSPLPRASVASSE